MREWRAVPRLIAILPIFVAIVWADGLYSRMDAYHASLKIGPLCTPEFFVAQVRLPAL